MVLDPISTQYMKDKILVTSYTDPDLDGLSSIFAYSDFLNAKGSNAIPSVYGKPYMEAAFIVREYGFSRPIEYHNPKEYREVVLVDASDLEGIDNSIDPKKVTQIIDHRKINDAEKFEKAKIQIELVGAAATLVAEKFIDNKIDIKEDVAPLLYGAIISNTLNFKANVTTDRDVEVASYLKEKFEFPDNFAHKMFESKSNLSGDALIDSIDKDFAFFKGWKFDGKKVGIAQLETLEGEEKTVPIKDEINAKLQSIKGDLGLDLIGFTIVDLEANQNIIFCPDEYSKDIFSKALGIDFEEGYAKRSGLILRKEIIPKIRDVIASYD